MFDFIRTHQRLMQLILLVLILPSFALIGVSGYTNYVSGDHEIVKVGDSAITLKEFDEARRNQLQQLQTNSGGAFDPSVLDNEPARKQLLESLIDRHVLLNAAVKNHFSVSDTVLRQTIASIPQLQDNGQFSAERYAQVLASLGLSSKDFEQSQRSELALQRVLGPVILTANVPKPVVQSIAQALTAERTVHVRTFAASDYKKDVKVSDADIKAWYEKNKEQLQLPDYVSADYLLLNEAVAMQSVSAISDDEMHKYYEQNKARYVLPARVMVSHILINVPSGATQQQRDAAKEQAEAIAKKVAADKSQFAQIARTESQDAGTSKDGGKLGWITKGSWPADLEKAVFALKKGEVSGVVASAGGYHIFMADDVQAERGETFDQAKSKVESEIRRQLAADNFAKMASQLTDLVYDNQSSLQPAADALGLKVKTANGISRQGLIPAAAVDGNAASTSTDAAVLDDARVRRALFSAQTFTDKQNSRVIEISPDTMIVVRVNSITPTHVESLEKSTDHIREQLLHEGSLSAAYEAGQKVLAAIEKKASTPVPEGFGAALTISRINPQGLDKQEVDAAFNTSLEKLPTYTGVKNSQGFALVRVDAAHAGKDTEAIMASLPLELDRAWGTAEQQAVLSTMRTTMGVEFLPEAKKALVGEAEQAE